MKTQQLLIRLSPEELEIINTAWKNALLACNGLINRSEFIRDTLLAALKETK